MSRPMVEAHGLSPRLRRAMRETHLPGEPGVWVLIFGDMLLFAAFFTAFLFYRGRDPQLFTETQAKLDVGIGVINTLLLLTSSLAVVSAVRAVRHEAQKRGSGSTSTWSTRRRSRSASRRGRTTSSCITTSSPGCTCFTS